MVRLFWISRQSKIYGQGLTAGDDRDGHAPIGAKEIGCGFGRRIRDFSGICGSNCAAGRNCYTHHVGDRIT